MDIFQAKCSVIHHHPELGLGFGYDFASQKSKDEQSVQQKNPTRGPEGQKCSGKCAPGVKYSNWQCLDATCGQLIRCTSHTHADNTPHPDNTPYPDNTPHKKRSGKWDSHGCDSQGFYRPYGWRNNEMPRRA
ncbi:MAG: hypothetical protein WCC17_23745 [Candidatus Nitrosopolaris sp.]